MNIVIAKGNMTGDPKVIKTATGKTKAEFTLALNRSKDGADFPRFIAWERTAELIEKYCHKGTALLVEGRIQTGSYEYNNGKVYTTDVVCDRIEFCDKKPKDGTEGQPKQNETEEFMAIPDGLENEIPFK